MEPVDPLTVWRVRLVEVRGTWGLRELYVDLADIICANQFFGEI